MGEGSKEMNITKDIAVTLDKEVAYATDLGINSALLLGTTSTVVTCRHCRTVVTDLL